MGQDSTDAHLATALMGASAITRLALAAAGRRLGLPTLQLQLLCRLGEQPRRMSDIAAELGLTRASATELVDRVAARGLAERSRDPEDRRSLVVALTADGHSASAAAHRATTEALAPALAGLGASERGELASLLGTLLR